MWDCMNRESIVPLVINMFTTAYMYFAFFISIKNVPMMVVSTVCNTSPLMTVLLAAIFLGERIKKEEIVCLLTAFFGIYLLVTQATLDTSSSNF